MGTNITGIGNANAIGFKSRVTGGIYFPPELKDALVGVWSAYGKSNDSTDRNIIKNKIKDRGGDFELLNFIYKENSGYGKYEIDFTTWNISNKITSVNSESFSFNVDVDWILLHCPIDISKDTPSFKVRIKINKGKGNIYYNYINKEGKFTTVVIRTEEYETPISYNTLYTGDTTNIGFTSGVKSEGGFSGTITQIPSFQGALVTDGVNDMIVSQKTVQEMLGGSTEITVVSMMANLDSRQILCNSNYNNTNGYNVRNTLEPNGVISMLGYTDKNGKTNNLNLIMGDKNSIKLTDKVNFNSDYVFYPTQYYGDYYQVAWYWTFIAKRVLTTDEINQVIAYYNLDKYVKPNVYYDVKKQGLSNDTPDEDWYLKDFSGNGRDMQLYNYGKTPESGINEEGALVFDGVEDYGQFVGDLGLKDYTVAVDRAYPKTINGQVPIVSNVLKGTNTQFVIEHLSGSVWHTFSFGTFNVIPKDIVKTNRNMIYQSTYMYNGNPITKGVWNGKSTGLTIGRYGTNTQYANIALWSLLLFPYTLSEFLLERQLKKYKLGTLYPDMIEFRPIAKSNIPYKQIDYFIKRSGTYVRLNPGDYFQSTEDIIVRVTPIRDWQLDVVSSIKVNGKDETINVSSSYTQTNPIHIDKSPQKIDITIDEYIRYEDIVHPYPTIFRLTDVDNNKEYTYGDKLKIGNKVKIASVKNLLPELYSANGIGIYNGNTVVSGNIITVEKTMTFGWSKPFIYLKANEPNCIAGPQRLRIPNSSYKILGYIPDISGHGNHLRFNNFAFTEESGVNEDGSIRFDGVDDFITIPTLSHGTKQVLMKVNTQNMNGILYDQRKSSGQPWHFAVYNTTEADSVAYNARNTNGKTYIDGVLNTNITCQQLLNITHNLTITNNGANEQNTQSPVIGASRSAAANFSKFALFVFMSFPEISDEDEIKELNDIVGIEGGYVESPDYYWDAYGKSNLDVDKGYIKDQVSLQLNNDTTNNNSLENFNFGYEGMSGYNGYPVIFGANKTWKNKAPEGPNSYICTINANKYNITQILLSNAWTYSYIKENGELTKYNKDVESFKIKVTGLKSEIPLRYSYLSSTDATVTSNITIKSDGTYELPKSFANDGSLIDNYGWIGFSFTRVSVDIPEIITDVNITIEILPEYKNGLVYDGVDDYSENASIPLLSDYTYIFKRTLLNRKYNSASIFKGSNQQSGGGAFICDYNSVEPDLLTQGYSFGAGLYVDSLNADSIVYGTRGSVNGTKITAGNNTDTEGLTVGKWRAYKEMVFYKLFLYPRTVNMLSINMVKNMMEEDGIIDLTSKLFTDKYTGDFYEMDFNNDFLIGN